MRTEKDELRQAMLALRRALPPAVCATASAQAAARLAALPALLDAQEARGVVALYAPIAGQNELDPLPLFAALRARGVTVVYPRVVGRGQALRFHAVDSQAQLAVAATASGKLGGIPEPTADLPEVLGTAVDLIVVPGLAFDPDGHRLGFGAGYYDMTLAAAPRALRVGYGYELQIVPRVPASAADQHVDVLVTEAGTRHTAARSRGDVLKPHHHTDPQGRPR